MDKYVNVIVSSGSRMTDRLFTYQLPAELEGKARPGQRIFVPFGRGNRKTPAVIISFEKEPDPDISYKKVISIIDGGLAIPEESIALIRFMAEEYLSDYSSALSAVLPPGSFKPSRPLLLQYYQLTEEGRKAEPRKNAVRQQRVLAVLREEGSLLAPSLLKKSGATTAVLHEMEERGWISHSSQRVFRREGGGARRYQKFPLTDDQKAVYQAIASKTGTYLICGVTGSGKTEIYLQLVEKTLREGKQAIVLVPEISLTPQTIERFEGRFGKQVAVLHSRLSQAERYEEWEKISHGQVSIAVGARSAIFAPFERLGLIVIDEEHDASYVSDRNPKYHTQVVAAFRARWHHCSLVLGSATPSMESLHQWEEGKLERLDLPQRVEGRPMPSMQLVDMREELKAGNNSMFSASLRQAMEGALARQQQVILFLNKRGHTSYVFCRDCGYVFRCDACDVALTYHLHQNRLVCHYCGRSKPYRTRCPQCGSERIREFGAGTEKLEEEVRRCFPQARVYRADSDTMKRKADYDRVYQDMLAGKIDILLGTQMIAKGFDFPGVTVVGVILADVTLNLPDLRAQEKTFQLITQVAGRAGRGDVPGRVFIQTYQPDNPALLAACRHDVDGFYRQESAYRKANFYPPFYSEMLVRISGADRRVCIEAGRKIRLFVEKWTSGREEHFRWEGPAPSVIERIDRKYRFSLVIRSDSRPGLRELGKEIINRFPTSRELNIVVTIDSTSVY